MRCLSYDLFVLFHTPGFQSEPHENVRSLQIKVSLWDE